MGKTIAFKDLFEIPLRNGLTKPKKIRGSGYKMINMGELFAYPIIKNLEMDRVPLKENEKISFLKNGDLLFARQSLVRSGAGQCSIFIEDNENVCFESHLIRCRLNTQIADPLFYFYFFKSNLGRTIMDNIVEQGAGVSGIRGSDLSELQVPYLDLNKQLEISQHLYTLDKKIELNTQTNQTLEAIAQAIFKSWFVDFDPVRAKAAALSEGKSEHEANLAAMSVICGKDTSELNDTEYKALWQIAEAFPSEFVENEEFGEVPKGWGVMKIEDVINKIPTGKKYSQKTVEETGKVPVLDQGRSGLIGFHNDEAGVKASIEDPVIVFANHTCYMRLISYDFSAIQNVFAFKGNNCNIYWLYLATLGKQKFTEYKGHFPDFLIKQIIIPNIELTKLFGDFVKPQFISIFENDKQIKILSEVRDLLLPKLLSGEI